MPKPRNEEDKKHGDKLEPLVDRISGGTGKRDEGADEDNEPSQDADSPNR